MAKVVRLSNEIEEVHFTKENALAYRRVLGVEKKDRVDTHVLIEREILKPFKGMSRGALSDAVNIGLNIVMVQRGML